jgi:hypothetical protein
MACCKRLSTGEIIPPKSILPRHLIRPVRFTALIIVLANIAFALFNFRNLVFSHIAAQAITLLIAGLLIKECRRSIMFYEWLDLEKSRKGRQQFRPRDEEGSRL